ncbi:UDP-galactose transporter [Novymonas esmeraldas]|uniref:UDP-galactose transporter n=1 Tax=Novymonas esmeraldas TaxID=1808958 RepID=A0AAW0EQF2_9TRYP
MGRPPIVLWVRRCLFNFNTLALLLLAMQNTGFLVLMCYSQQRDHREHEPVAAGGAEGQRTEAEVEAEAEVSTASFQASHFLATTELIKLLISVVWCAIDEARAMERERAAEAESKAPSSAVLLLDRHGAGGDGAGELQQRPSAFGDADSAASAHTPASVPPPTASQRARTHRPMGPRWMPLFSRRMRSAVGLDHKYREALLMIVPAVVYALQGLLLIYALKLLDPTVFQVLYQVRIIFLAFMMRAVLDLRLSAVRWAALVALMLGITLAQLGSQGGRAEPSTLAPDRAVQAEMDHAEAAERSAATVSGEGTLAALAGGFLSAFSGVFMEYVLKKRRSHFHLSARNIHLAFFSVLYFLLIFARDVLTSSEAVGLAESTANFMNGFFEGFTGLVWFLVVLQAIGGMLVALVVRYCDNIVKSFSTAFAIVLSGTASVLLFNTPMTATFVAGSLLVMGSITLYSVKG